MITTLPLVGVRSLKCLNVFNLLLLGLKMTPPYMGVTYPMFFEALKDCDELTRETILREALALVELDPDEVESILSFTTDSNGVPISRANIKNLPPDEIFERLLAVLLEVGKIRITLLTKEEKERIKEFSVDGRETFAKYPDVSLEDGMNLAFYEALKCLKKE